MNATRATEKMPRSSKPPALSEIAAGWRDTLARRADAAAVLSADGSVVRTFEQIEAEARDFEAGAMTLPSGSIVAVQIGNSASWPAIFLGLHRAGCATLPLGSDAAPPGFAHAVLGGDLQWSIQASSRAVPEGTTLLKLTSGTTGEPRAIRFTAAQLAADCSHVCDTMGIIDADVNFGVIPFAHSYGFSNLITPLLLRGVPIVASEDRFPRAILDGLTRSGATVFPGAPVLFQHLAELDAPRPPRLRLCISAGAPLSRAVWEKFHSRFGLRLHTFYGSSECGGIAYDRTGELPEEGFVGAPMRGVEVTVANDGRIEIRSAAVGAGYFPKDDPTLGGGCFRPADLVHQTARGLVLAGRESDFINVAGRKLNPCEVEHVLAQFPGVQQVIVFGVPSKVRGEEPVACIVGDVDAAALLRDTATALAPWQVPRDVWLVPELPVNERGKISRRAMAERYSAR